MVGRARVLFSFLRPGMAPHLMIIAISMVTRTVSIALPLGPLTGRGNIHITPNHAPRK